MGDPKIEELEAGKYLVSPTAVVTISMSLDELGTQVAAAISINRKMGWNMQPGSNQPMITDISVEKLFHDFTYTISPSSIEGTDDHNLVLLYGNNGSGKTTILNILYHLLDPEPYGGHRSFVGGVPFQKFVVKTSLGYSIAAIREPGELTGKYQLYAFNEQGKSIASYTWIPEEKKKDGLHNEEGYKEFCDILDEMKLSFHYLRDSRRVESGANTRKSSSIRNRLAISPSDYEFYLHERDHRHPRAADETDQLLLAVLGETVDWIKARSILSTNEGHTNVNVVYRNVIKRIISKEGREISSISELSQLLLDLAKENEAFARFGLTPELDIRSLTSELEKGDQSDVETLNAIIGPYIEGHTARLEALDELRSVIENFVDILAGFFEGKKIEYDVRKGLTIFSRSGHELNPTELSSGERQLLLLFCNAIISRDHRTILIIDEPEISLNVKWQRNLIPALLRCLEGTEYQLLIATHSIEILSQYRSSVQPLEDLSHVAE